MFALPLLTGQVIVSTLLNSVWVAIFYPHLTGVVFLRKSGLGIRIEAISICQFLILITSLPLKKAWSSIGAPSSSFSMRPLLYPPPQRCHPLQYSHQPMTKVVRCPPSNVPHPIIPVFLLQDCAWGVPQWRVQVLLLKILDLDPLRNGPVVTLQDKFPNPGSGPAGRNQYSSPLTAGLHCRTRTALSVSISAPVACTGPVCIGLALEGQSFPLKSNLHFSANSNCAVLRILQAP